MQLVHRVKQKLFEARNKGFSLETRFLTTLLVAILILFFAFTIVFAAFGVFDMSRSQTVALLTHELNTKAELIKKELASIASHSISLSESLTMELERRLQAFDVPPPEIALNPDILNDLMDNVYPTLAAELKAIKSSGVFIILDATINPAQENAEHSKAGLFLKNISAQNNAFSSHYDLRYLYGSFDIGRDHGIAFLPQWQLEFNTESMDMYNTAMRTARENPDSSLSQLYYWTAKESDGASDYGMYCTVPLVASDGTVMGVCGYEIGRMQFKLAYAPTVTGQDYVFCMLSPSDENNIYFQNAMFAGNYAVSGEQPKCTVTKPSGDGILDYRCDAAGHFVGRHTDVSLYPNSSCYSDNEFALVLLTPKSQITQISRVSNLKYIIVIGLLLIAAIVLSILLCRRNIKPVKNALTELHNSRKPPTNKTYIREIDNLFEFLAQKDQENENVIMQIEREKKEAEAKVVAHEIERGDPELYEHFLANLSLLTAKERDVFELYLKGYKAKEIAEALDVTSNTIKFHSRNIYDKLGVSSRNELLRYAAMIKAMKGGSSV